MSQFHGVPNLGMGCPLRRCRRCPSNPQGGENRTWNLTRTLGEDSPSVVLSVPSFGHSTGLKSLFATTSSQRVSLFSTEWRGASPINSPFQGGFSLAGRSLDLFQHPNARNFSPFLESMIPLLKDAIFEDLLLRVRSRGRGVSPQNSFGKEGKAPRHPEVFKKDMVQPLGR